MRYALKVAYDGTNYCGWQIQKNGITVQQVVQSAIYTAFNEQVTVTASGRTDSGVHAEGQVCHVDLQANIQGEKLADAINARLPQDVSVLASCVAPQGFDANRSAKKKTYCYNLYFAPRHNPLMDRYALWVKGSADVEKLKKAANLFLGEHDFKAYCASRSQVLTTVRTIYSIEVCPQTLAYGTSVSVYVCGNGFLYNMVRTLVGTLLWYSFDKLTLEDIKTSIEACDRNKVGKTLPANGLVLKDVDYGIKLF